jgi:pimeloyl-ACP methyl ester carboxylesterase
VDSLRQIGTHLRTNIFAVEYPGYGINYGQNKPDPELIKQDAIDMYQHINKKLEFAHENIIVMGRSIGCGAACHLAANVPEVANLVLMSPFESVNSIASDKSVSLIGNRITNFFDNKKCV